MSGLNIVFMGTPGFALPSLDLIKLSDHQLLALVVPPDRPVGRGRKECYAPSKEWALKNKLQVLQPQKVGDPQFVNTLRDMAPDLVVTVAYGKILPPAILTLPPLGCINLHASYLPAYRGSAPIHRAVIDGATKSGVSIIYMTPELDAGDVVMQEEETISLYDTAGMLHDRLATRGAGLLLKAIDALAESAVKSQPQDHDWATYAPPLQAEDEKIDWQQSSMAIYNRIRGLNPWPGAYTIFGDKRLKIWSAILPDQKESERQENTPGTILAVGEESMTVATADGAITILNLQPAGKQKMDAGSFCCGYRIEPGCCLDGGE